jgi:putative DNA primase/helicase
MIAGKIASVLGGARRCGRWWRCVCPVHGSRTGRSLTLALRDHPRGLAVHCHAGCSRDQILAELRRLELFGDEVEYRPPSVPVNSDRSDHTARRMAVARRLWEEAQDARGSPVARYLRSRGIEIVPPLSLRWTPACRHPGGRTLPAMLARIEAVDGEFIGVHRTFLTADGSGKAVVEPAKAMLGRAAGGAVRLAPAAEVLMIGEGIETCLAAMTATGRPSWSAISVGGIEVLTLPALVKTAIILADHDRNARGERAARTAAQRWLAEGRQVRIALPPEPGSDFNDVLLARGRAP